MKAKRIILICTSLLLTVLLLAGCENFDFLNKSKNSTEPAAQNNQNVTESVPAKENNTEPTAAPTEAPSTEAVPVSSEEAGPVETEAPSAEPQPPETEAPSAEPQPPETEAPTEPEPPETEAPTEPEPPETEAPTEPEPSEPVEPQTDYTWSVIGDVLGSYWNVDYPMTEVSPNVYELEMDLFANEELKVRRDYSWDVNFGGDGLRDGANLVVEAPAHYLVRLEVFDEETASLTITPAIPASAWSVIGRIHGTNWDADFPMYELEDGSYTSMVLRLFEHDELKVRKDGDWGVNFGADGSRDGPNLIVEEDGSYVLVLTVNEDESAAQVELVAWED